MEILDYDNILQTEVFVANLIEQGNYSLFTIVVLSFFGFLSALALVNVLLEKYAVEGMSLLAMSLLAIVLVINLDSTENSKDLYKDQLSELKAIYKEKEFQLELNEIGVLKFDNERLDRCDGKCSRQEYAEIFKTEILVRIDILNDRAFSQLREIGFKPSIYKIKNAEILEVFLFLKDWKAIDKIEYSETEKQKLMNEINSRVAEKAKEFLTLAEREGFNQRCYINDIKALTNVRLKSYMRNEGGCLYEALLPYLVLKKKD